MTVSDEMEKVRQVVVGQVVAGLQLESDDEGQYWLLILADGSMVKLR